MNLDELWNKVSKEQLWKGLTEWQDFVRRARVISCVVLESPKDMPVLKIAQKTGENEVWIEKILSALEEQGVAARASKNPASYRIADEQKLIAFIRACCQQASIASGALTILANGIAGQGSGRAARKEWLRMPDDRPACGAHGKGFARQYLTAFSDC